MILIVDELGNAEKNILELIENVGFKECKIGRASCRERV